LGEATLTELEAGLAQFEATSTEVNGARREHVGARAELIEIADRCIEVIGRLDGLVRARFRKDVEQLAAWESARNLPAGFRTRPRTANGEVPDDAGGAAPAPP